MEIISLNTNDMEWQQAKNYPEGTMSKILRDDGERKTILLKVPPGFKMDSHSHTVVEQHFILEGEYEIGGKIHKVGSYQLIPQEYTHGPFYSENGAVILVIWDAYK
jgi:anti-sigma factor ChrR (cupin superfamily)